MGRITHLPISDSRLPVTISQPPGTPWYIVRTYPEEELRVDDGLRGLGVETFLPQIDARMRRKSGVARLFPNHLFARFDLAAFLRQVRSTRGVQDIVRFGGRFATVDDEVIALLGSHLDERGLVRLGEPLPADVHASISESPFLNMARVVEQHLSDADRVAVLLSCVQTAWRKLHFPRSTQEPCGAHIVRQL